MAAELYPNTDTADFTETEDDASPKTIIKKTLISSPIFIDIYAKFMVQVNKPFRGLSGTSLNDEEYQNMLPTESNSQDWFEDEDLMMDLDNDALDTDAAPLATEPIFESVKVIVKSKSLIVDEVEFPINVEIRTTTIIKGKQKLNGTFEEDSLFISLKSGFLLLIRLYYVPRYYKDSHYEFQTSEINHTGNSIYKPFAVQWWDASSPSWLKVSGFQLSTERSGLSVVSTSSYKCFRIYNTQSTSNGIILRKHQNVFVDGLILHSCFAEPLEESAVTGHVSFLTLVFTDKRRLWLQLYSWSCEEGESIHLSKSSLPLENTFKIPIFIIPLKLNGGFLFVLPDEIVLITIHQIISAEYDFKRFKVPWNNTSFPTNYYIAATNIASDMDTLEEILISTDDGIIYSLKVNLGDYGIKFEPILRVPNSISVFSLEASASNYSLIFGSDGENNQELLIPKLFTGGDQTIRNKLNYIDAKLLRNYGNWSPLVDFQILDPKKSEYIFPRKELWGLTGNGRRSRITQFRYGYSAMRRSKVYEKLRKCIRMFYVSLDDKQYLLCSFSFRSIIIESQSEVEYSFLAIDNVEIDEATIYATSLKFKDVDTIFYVTPTKINLTNFTDLKIMNSMEGKRILFGGMESNVLGLIYEEILNDSTKITLEIYTVDLNSGFDETLLGSVFTKIMSWDINYEPSCLSLLLLDGSVVASVGSYQGNVNFYNYNTLDSSKYATLDLSLSNAVLELADIIPSDVYLAKNYLFVGTSNGQVFTIILKLAQSLEFSIDQSFRISDSPVYFTNCETSEPILFIYSKQLWMLNKYESKLPERVYFDQTYETSISHVIRFPHISSLDDNLRSHLAIIREDGLTVASVLSFKEPTLRQVSVGEKAQKFQFLEQFGLFIVLCKSKHVSSRLKFIERKSLKVIPHLEFDMRSQNEPKHIFEQDEIPMSSCTWIIRRSDRVSKKLLVGCSNVADPHNKSGCIKVLDIVKSKKRSGVHGVIRISELTSYAVSDSVNHVIQFEDIILFSGGQKIFYTSYDMDAKKLKPPCTLVTLSSDVTVLEYIDDLLLVTTKYDSLYQFKLTTTNEGMSARPSYHDPTPNSYVNHSRHNSYIFSVDKLHSSLLVFDEKRSNKTSFTISGIAKVFASAVGSPWENVGIQSPQSHMSTICVGISGEIFVVGLVKHENLVLKLLLGSQDAKGEILLNQIIDRNMIPVRNKISGTGLFSFSKLCFDYKKNIGNLIDYDLDEMKADLSNALYGTYRSDIP